jgi:TonB family protein
MNMLIVAHRRALRTALVALVVLSSARAFAADSWIEAKSLNFTVVSNAGEKKARNVAWQFEQIRSAMEKGWPWARVQLNRPVVIIAVKNEAGMKELAPSFWEQGEIHPGSVLRTAPDRHYVLLRSDLEGEDREGVNPHRQSYWSYSALVIESSFSRGLPLWFSRGLSAVLSNSIVRENEIQFGRAIPAYVRAMQQQSRLRLEQLLTVDAKSPYFTSEATRAQFDAQCWALMQYLFFGDTEQGGWDRINALTKLLLQGKTSQDAVREVYGTPDKLEAGYLNNVRRGLITYARLQVDTEVSAQKYPTRDLPEAESAAVRAGFHAAMGRTVEARALLDLAKAADARQPAAYVVQGLTFDRENKPGEAKQAYEKAAELNSTNFYPYLRLANLTRANADPASLAATQKLLAKSIALNDGFAPSFYSLAQVMLQLKQPQSAVGLAQRAAALEPAQSAYRLMLARVFAQLSKREDALNAAQEAMDLARTDQEQRAARTLLDSLQRPEPSGRAVGGVAGGVVGGIAGGSAGVAPPPPPPPPPAAPVRVGGDIKPPARLKYVPAAYPPAAQSARVQGVVVVEAIIGPNGKVTDAKIIRSIPLLDAAALEAVRQWEYAPTMVNGRPVSVYMTVSVNFTLQ